MEIDRRHQSDVRMKTKILSSHKMENIEQLKSGMEEESLKTVPNTAAYKTTLMRLKEEFEQRFSVSEKSESSEKLKEYKFLAILGQGAFGLVVIYHFFLRFPQVLQSGAFPFLSIQKLVKHERTENFYAVKIIAKELLIKSKQVNHTLNEKQILRAIKFPFVVCLEFSMKDNSYLYFGMPFINGGEMFSHLR